MRRLLIGAVVLALAVPAVAQAARVFVTGKEIKNGTVKSQDVRNGTLKLKDLSPQTIAELRGQQGLPGPAGADGPQGPPGPLVPTVEHVLYVEDGTDEISHVTYELDPPVPLNEIGELIFFQELVHGTGSFGANVILGVNADGDAIYEADDIAFHIGPNPVTPGHLGGDSFLEMDALPPGTVKVNAPAVQQWYSPNQVGDGYANAPGCEYNQTLQQFVANCGADRLEPTDDVHLVRLLIGGSPSWIDLAIRVAMGKLP